MVVAWSRGTVRTNERADVNKSYYHQTTTHSVSSPPSLTNTLISTNRFTGQAGYSAINKTLMLIERNFIRIIQLVFVSLFPSFIWLAVICDGMPDRYERKIVLELIGNLDK